MMDVEYAFPIPSDSTRDYGMTMRDYFAAKAMESILNARISQKSGVVGTNNFEHFIASEAFAVADAMMRAREA